MGYIRGLMHGAAVGTVVGLCIAPQTGDKTRAQIRLMTAVAREGAMTTGRALSKRPGPCTWWRPRDIAASTLQTAPRRRAAPPSSVCSARGCRGG
jgi:hypothetical protein